MPPVVDYAITHLRDICSELLKGGLDGDAPLIELPSSVVGLLLSLLGGGGLVVGTSIREGFAVGVLESGKRLGEDLVYQGHFWMDELWIHDTPDAWKEFGKASRGVGLVGVLRKAQDLPLGRVLSKDFEHYILAAEIGYRTGGSDLGV